MALSCTGLSSPLLWRTHASTEEARLAFPQRLPAHALSGRPGRGRCALAPPPRRRICSLRCLRPTRRRAELLLVAAQKAPKRVQQKPGAASWRLLELAPYLVRWEVPWGAPTVALGLGGWAASFLFSGAILAPLLAGLCGVNVRELAGTQQTEYVAALQSLETFQGLAIIWLCTRKYQPLPDGLFRLDSSRPLSPEGGWLAWSGLFYLACFPAIGAAAGLTSLLSEAQAVQDQGAGTVDAILPLISSDALSFASLLAVTGVLAPVLEEVVFRGFLLVSLSKWMPAPAAVLASSTLFAAAHFAPRDAPQLLALGLVLGFSYVRTRNLLVPVVVHGLWNSGVLVALTVLSSQGTDLQQALRGP